MATCDHKLNIESKQRATCERCGEAFESFLDANLFRCWRPAVDLYNQKIVGSV